MSGITCFVQAVEMDKLLNFLLFQAGWFACVLLGQTSYYLLGPVLVAGIVLYHLKRVENPTAERQLLLIALLVGLVWENLLAVSGLLVYPTGQLYGLLAPIWIVVMWPLMAITLNFSLRWIRGKTWLAVVFGAVGGPLAFLAGERLGSVTFSDRQMAITLLAIGWAVLFPLMMKFAGHYDGRAYFSFSATDAGRRSGGFK